MSGLPASAGAETLALQQELARLQALLEASRQIHGTIVLDEVIRCTLEIAVKELEASGAFLTPGETLAGAAVTTYGNVPELWAKGLEGEAWSGFPQIPLHDKRDRELTRLVLLRDAPLSLEEQDFLEGLALQSAVALENARHHSRMLAWERVQQDLAAARVIQRSLLPQSIPHIPGYLAGFRATSCYEVGGDYVDMIPLGDGRAVMIVADVAGKGLASALVSASFRMAFRAMATAGIPLNELAARLNDLHHAEGIEARRRYVTAILLLLDPAAHQVRVVNAGHTPGFLVGPGIDPVLLESSGAPFGMLPGMTYETDVRDLPPGGRVLLYTDGLSEVFRGDDEEFGSERLLDCFAKASCDNCQDALEYLWKELAEFSGNAEQSDDMTALALMRGSL